MGDQGCSLTGVPLQFYNVWLSLFGFAACVTIMFLIDWISSLITFAVVLSLYMVVVYRKPDVNWVRMQSVWLLGVPNLKSFLCSSKSSSRDQLLKLRPTRLR